MELALPAIGEGVYEAELIRWRVAPGDAVKRGDVLLELMTDKATMEVPSPFAGTIDTLSAEPGQTLAVGQVILTYSATGERGPPPAAPAPGAPAAGPAEGVVNGAGATHAPSGVPAPTPLSVKASPSVRQMARKLGLDLTTLPGSGPAGRVLIDDLSRHLRFAAARGHEGPPPRGPAPLPALDLGRPGTRVKVAGMRRRIAEHMVHSARTIPHFSYVDECDVTDLVRLRTSLKEVYQRQGVKLTYMAFFVKAVAAALREVPIVNASLDESCGEIVLHDRYHIGVAVATPAGLIVPVVRDADRKDVGTLAREVDRLSAEARAGRSRLEDLRGGTFTVSSVGNVGGLFSTPVINHPEVGILGLGKVVRRPVYGGDGQVRPADLIYLSFSFDHRVLDGAVGAVFANAVLAQLRNPAAMLVPPVTALPH